MTIGVALQKDGEEHRHGSDQAVEDDGPVVAQLVEEQDPQRKGDP